MSKSVILDNLQKGLPDDCFTVRQRDYPKYYKPSNRGGQKLLPVAPMDGLTPQERRSRVAVLTEWYQAHHNGESPFQQGMLTIPKEGIGPPRK